ncbi:MAG TPA: hypothetical protein VHH73_10645 [Verrucomicrobiae bacterium]|nr:hypothetical protein [Verrucomicrobiae bacterium]
MPDKLTALEFSFEDQTGGQPLTLDTIDLPALRALLEEAEKFIKGEQINNSLSESRIRLESGSVKLVATVAEATGANIRADLAKLAESGDLDAIDRRRAEVVEKWQARSKDSSVRKYSIRVGDGDAALQITGESEFRHGGEDAWVTVEKYLMGKVTNAGGKQAPNVHLVLADSGETVVVNATEEELKAEKDNQLYKDVTVRVRAKQHLRTKKLRDLRLIQFVPRASDVDEQALARLWKEGREAWKDVPSATVWVETMRGNQ